MQAQDQFGLAGNKLNSSAHRVFALAEIGNNSDTMLAVRDIEVALDIMRATVWRFQVTLDPKDMSSFKANVQNMNATVETFGQVANAQAKAPLGDLTAAVKSYDDTFTAVAKAMIGERGSVFQSDSPSPLRCLQDDQRRQAVDHREPAGLQEGCG